MPIRFIDRDGPSAIALVMAIAKNKHNSTKYPAELLGDPAGFHAAALQFGLDSQLSELFDETEPFEKVLRLLVEGAPDEEIGRCTREVLTATAVALLDELIRLKLRGENLRVLDLVMQLVTASAGSGIDPKEIESLVIRRANLVITEDARAVAS